MTEQFTVYHGASLRLGEQTHICGFSERDKIGNGKKDGVAARGRRSTYCKLGIHREGSVILFVTLAL